ncbi:MAG: histidine phosphatase family protein [Pseudomonadota bacterium]
MPRSGLPILGLMLCLMLGVMLGLMLGAVTASAEPRWAALDAPGRIALMRHALAPGTGDPVRFRLGDCSTQRNLDARGRQQAQRIGAALRAAGIAFDRVLTSQWCRCRDTAQLLDIGAVEDFAPLNSFFRDSSAGPSQTEALRRFLAGRAPGAPLMLVTHQVNITALTGVFPRSGEVIIIEVDPEGAVTVVDRVLIDP